MVRIAFLLAVVAGRVFAQRTPQTTAPPMSNGTAVLVSLFKPVYPLLARQANISGEVRVALTVRPDGTTKAAVESGHPMLIQAALDSAKQSRFECRACSAPVSYLLVYSFKLTTAGDCCDAFSVPPQVEQEPQSIDPQGRPLCRSNPHITQLTRSEAKNKTSMLKETWDERHIFGEK
jgi:TonB family protein